MSYKYHEEVYLGYQLFVNECADTHLDGYSWSVSKDDIEFDCGMDFTMDDAVKSAKSSIEKLTNKQQ